MNLTLLQINVKWDDTHRSQRETISTHLLIWSKILLRKGGYQGLIFLEVQMEGRRDDAKSQRDGKRNEQ